MKKLLVEIEQALKYAHNSLVKSPKHDEDSELYQLEETLKKVRDQLKKGPIQTGMRIYFESCDPNYPSGFMKDNFVYTSEQQALQDVAKYNNMIGKVRGDYIIKRFETYEA